MNSLTEINEKLKGQQLLAIDLPFKGFQEICLRFNKYTLILQIDWIEDSYTYIDDKYKDIDVTNPEQLSEVITLLKDKELDTIEVEWIKGNYEITFFLCENKDNEYEKDNSLSIAVNTVHNSYLKEN